MAGRPEPGGRARAPLGPGHPSTGSQRTSYYGWTVVAALGVTTVVSYGTTSYAFGVLIVPVSLDLGWSRAALSGALALGVLVAGVLGVPIGLLVDRYGARALLSIGSTVGGLCLLALSTVDQIWQFDALWGIGVGLATALTFYPVSFTVVANWFEGRRGTALAWLTTLGGLASTIFIPLTAGLVVWLGWRGALVALGVCQLGIALPLHVGLVRRHPEDLGLRPDGESSSSAPNQFPLSAVSVHTQVKSRDRLAIGMGTADALHSVAFWTLTVAASLDQLAITVVWTHQIAFAINRGFDPVLAAGAAGLLGLMSLPGRFALNRLSDRVSARWLLAAVLALLGVAVALLDLGRSAAQLYAFVVIYGLAFGARSPLRASVMAEWFGRRAYGAITAAQGLVVAAPAALGPLAAGWLYDRLGNYELAFALTSGAFVLAAIMVIATPRHPLK